MSSPDSQTVGSVPVDPFKTDLSDASYNPSSPPTNSYFPPQTIQSATTPLAAGFDLNAAGDDDEDVDGQMIYQEGSAQLGETTAEADEVDRRSVYVGNVDYGATPPELQEHFKNCGAINRITIMVDRYTGHPKGYAYIEFQDETAIPNAVSLNESTFRERLLKVVAKRKNLPGFSSTTRGRGSFGRGGHSGRGFRGGTRGRGRGMRGISAYAPRYRGRGGRGVAPY